MHVLNVVVFVIYSWKIRLVMTELINWKIKYLYWAIIGIFIDQVIRWRSHHPIATRAVGVLYPDLSGAPISEEIMQNYEHNAQETWKTNFKYAKVNKRSWQN